MTGLDTINDSIIEMASIVTDGELNVLAEGPVLAIQQDEEVLKAMDHWNRSHHTDSGLWQRVVHSPHSLRAAELANIEFLKDWVEKGTSPMCGNSICQDRRFLARCMPELEDYFMYRNLDVSTLKELARRWAPDVAKSVVKNGSHLAMDDIKDSIAELEHYRKHMFIEAIAAPTQDSKAP